jgi:hypothetical protein
VRVNIRCRAFTLRHLPSRVAFAIRICIPLTFRSTRRQSTAYQFSGAWESADPVFRPDTFMLLSYLEKSPSRRRISPSGADTPRWGTTIALSTDACIRTSPSYQGSVSHLATVDQTEVCPLSRGVMSQPLSGPLTPGIRFFRRPIPAQSTAFLTVRLPANQHRRKYGLTTFPACHMTDLGSAFSPAALRRRVPRVQRENRPLTILVSAQ